MMFRIVLLKAQTAQVEGKDCWEEEMVSLRELSWNVHLLSTVPQEFASISILYLILDVICVW